MALPISPAACNAVRWTRITKTLARLTICIVAVTAVTAILYALPLHGRPLFPALPFFFLILIVSAVWGFRYAVFVSFLATLGFMWLLTPVGQFWLDDPRDWFALASFLVIGIVTSHLSERARRETLNAKQRRAEAVAAQQRFADLLNAVEGIVWEADADTLAFSFISQKAERILGYPIERWLGEPTFWKNHIHADDRDWVVDSYLKAMANDSSRDFEYRMIAADGNVVWLRDLITVVFEDGRASRMRGVMVDVTLRKQAEDVARRSEKELRAVIDTMPVMAWTTLPDGSNIFVNKGWTEYTGLSVEDSKGPGWQTAAQPEDLDRYLEKWRASLASGQPFESEVRFRRAADAEYRWFLARAVPLRDERGNILKWYGMLTDIEDRKRAEQERERLRRLEAELAYMSRVITAGELTASLAHVIKQPITAAVMNANACARWLRRDAPDVTEACDAAALMVTDVTRAADIIDRVRSLYRRDAPERERVDLNEIIREMVVLLHDTANRNSISIRTELDVGLPTATADRVQLQQVVMNLMLNGIEAMKDTGGELTVTSNRTEDGQLLISVSDLGIGLPVDQTERIFEAFFTTKPQGTGMGLSISQRIIESHGGRLWASAHTGRGATFQFRLPSEVTASSPSAS
jgi:PAS domain S-box-containing protein